VGWEREVYKGKRVCVVIPCYNVAGSILEVIRGLPDLVDAAVVVDDGSTDGTLEAVSGLGDPRVTLLRHQKNEGVGSAIVTGHKKAIEMGADLSVVMAGDNQMDPVFLPDLLSAVVDEGYDLSKANRFLRAGHLRGMPTHRVAGNTILTFMTKLASGYWNIFDPQNGFTCIRTETLRGLDLDGLDKGYNFENDILVHLNVLGASVKDVPCPARYGDAKSGIRPVRFLARSVLFLTKRFFYRVYRKYILYDFGAYSLLFFPGLALFLVGLWYGVLSVYIRYLSPLHRTPSTGTIVLAGVTLVLGIQLLLTAFIFDVLQVPRPEKRPTQ
jgi:glycosyltransferase involved in cell wall biosynthesis